MTAEDQADVPSWIYTLVYLAWLDRGGLLRARPAPDELAGDRPQRQPAVARRAWSWPSIATLADLVVRDRAASSGIAWAIIVVGFLIGGGAGLYTARTVKMTAMPQLVSLFNAVGGGAAALVAIDDFVRLAGERQRLAVDTTIFVVLGVVIGSVTFTGSLIAVGQAPGPDPRQADHRPRRPDPDDRAGRDRGRSGPSS